MTPRRNRYWQNGEENWIARCWSEFFQDLRHGVRGLAAQPGFTFAAVTALVLGIGVNAVLFSIFNTLALAPWAVRDAAHTVQVLADGGAEGRSRWSGMSWPHYRYLRDHSAAFEGLAAHSAAGTRLRLGDSSGNVTAAIVSENYFEVLGTGFAAGRGLSPSSGNLLAPAPEIVLHYDTWISRFGGDPAVVGRWLELGGHQLQVVGVAAQGFNGTDPVSPHMWIPGAWGDILNPGLETINAPGSCCVYVVGLLKPEVSRAFAQAELAALTAQFLESVRRKPQNILLTDPATLANPSTFGRAAAILLVVGVAAFLILLLACANVANLQIARTMARRREIAVRLSLGAGRGRILRQFLTESLLVSGAAGLLSLAVTAWTPSWILRQIVPKGEKLSFVFETDLRVLTFILAATILSALLFGLAPTWSALGSSAADGLRAGGRATSSGRLRSVLLGVQVALCAILLSGTALLVRALDRVRHLDTGIRYEQVVVLSTGLESTGINDEQSRALLLSLINRVSALPGVEGVAHGVMLPFGNRSNGAVITHPRTRERVNLGYNEVSADYFRVLGIALLSGRGFTRADESGKNVAIVNQAAAQRLWPGESPLGK